MKIKKLKAASLLESVVALAVIMGVFGIGMMVYVNVTRSGYGRIMETARSLDSIAVTTKLREDYDNGTISLGELTVHKTCQAYKGEAGLIELHLEAVDAHGRILAEHREIVLRKKDE